MTRLQGKRKGDADNATGKKASHRQQKEELCRFATLLNPSSFFTLPNEDDDLEDDTTLASSLLTTEYAALQKALKVAPVEVTLELSSVGGHRHSGDSSPLTNGSRRPLRLIEQKELSHTTRTTLTRECASLDEWWLAASEACPLVLRGNINAEGLIDETVPEVEAIKSTLKLLSVFEEAWQSDHPTKVNVKKPKSGKGQLAEEGSNKGLTTFDGEELPLGLQRILLALQCASFQLDDSEDALLKAVLKSVEFVLTAFPAERSTLGSGYILALLLKVSGAKGGVASDVSKIYKARDVLSYVDFDDPASDFLRGQLTRCFCDSAFFGTNDGRRFLSFVLGSLHPHLSSAVMVWVRQLIPTARRQSGLLKSLSSVMFNAWRLSTSGIKMALEAHLQEMVELAILCEPKAASRMRECLIEFHTKGDSAASDFVYRTYSPLLYRYLPVANWKVRFNAAALFAVSFPLVDVGLPTGEYAAEVERQYATLVKLSEDQHPEVRRAAVQGVCRVLSTFWEMIPLDKATLLLESLLTKAARDRSSHAVRTSVIEGLMGVLDNPMSHTALKALLPQLSGALQDTNPLVRLKMAELLRKISNLEDFSYVSVVPLDGILPRLVKDGILGGLEVEVMTQRGLRPSGMSDKALSVPTSESLSTSHALCSLISSSVFVGSDELTKQVERVLLMTDKFPLALLTVIESTAPSLEVLDRVRLSVAIFNIAAMKSRGLSNILIDGSSSATDDVDELILAKQRKSVASVKVLLSAVAKLLLTVQFTFDQARRNEESTSVPAIKGSAKAPKKKAGAASKAKATARSNDNSADAVRELEDFLKGPLSSDALAVLMAIDSPVAFDAMRVFTTLPFSVSSYSSVRSAIQLWLSNGVPTFKQSKDAEGLLDKENKKGNRDSPPTPIQTTAFDMAALLEAADHIEILRPYLTNWAASHLGPFSGALDGSVELDGEGTESVLSSIAESRGGTGDTKATKSSKSGKVTSKKGSRPPAKRSRRDKADDDVDRPHDNDVDDDATAPFNGALKGHQTWQSRTDSAGLLRGCDVLNGVLSHPKLSASVIDDIKALPTSLFKAFTSALSIFTAQLKPSLTAILTPPNTLLDLLDCLPVVSRVALRLTVQRAVRTADRGIEAATDHYDDDSAPSTLNSSVADNVQNVTRNLAALEGLKSGLMERRDVRNLIRLFSVIFDVQRVCWMTLAGKTALEGFTFVPDLLRSFARCLKVFEASSTGSENDKRFLLESWGGASRFLIKLGEYGEVPMPILLDALEAFLWSSSLLSSYVTPTQVFEGTCSWFINSQMKASHAFRFFLDGLMEKIIKEAEVNPSDFVRWRFLEEVVGRASVAVEKAMGTSASKAIEGAEQSTVTQEPTVEGGEVFIPLEDAAEDIIGGIQSKQQIVGSIAEEDEDDKH